MNDERGTINTKFDFNSSFIVLVHRFVNPAHDHDARAAFGGGFDLEFVREATRAGQALPETAAGGESVAHGGFDVRNTGHGVFEDERKPFAPVRVRAACAITGRARRI
jgi:hypothetical protein